jgi:hypothetical protein
MEPHTTRHWPPSNKRGEVPADPKSGGVEEIGDERCGREDTRELGSFPTNSTLLLQTKIVRTLSMYMRANGGSNPLLLHMFLRASPPASPK